MNENKYRGFIPKDKNMKKTNKINDYISEFKVINQYILLGILIIDIKNKIKEICSNRKK